MLVFIFLPLPHSCLMVSECSGFSVWHLSVFIVFIIEHLLWNAL